MEHNLPCLIWWGSYIANGRPVVYRALYGNQPKRSHVYAYRMVYEECFGPITDGLEVCHTCDTPACVQPYHLFTATHLENMRDMADKGRWNNQMVGRLACKHGHLWTEANTAFTPEGHRRCKECARISMRAITRRRGLKGRTKDVCPRGHLRTHDNIYTINRSGRKPEQACKICKDSTNQRQRDKRTKGSV